MLVRRTSIGKHTKLIRGYGHLNWNRKADEDRELDSFANKVEERKL